MADPDDDLGCLQPVGWGWFSLPGERRRLEAAEKRRLDSINSSSGINPVDPPSTDSESC